MPKSANDKLLEQALEDALDISRITTKEREKVRRVLRNLKLKLKGRMSELPDLLKMSPSRRRTAIRKFLREADKEIAAQFSDFGEEFTATLSDLAVYEAAAAVTAINAAVGVELAKALNFNAEQARVLVSEAWISGSTVEEMINGMEETFAREFKRIVREGYMMGETNDEIARRISGYTDKEGAYHAGIAEGVARKSAERMVRTATMGIANAVREEVFRSNEEVIKGREWLATLDTRTCLECAARDGKAWDMEGRPIGGHFIPYAPPPLHLQCLTGDTFVTPIGTVSGVSKRWVEGEIVLIKTASGNVLSCTPNHPILTLNGWVPACKIDKVGHVFCCVIGQGGRFVDHDVKNVPTTIEEIVSSFLSSPTVKPVPMPTATEDFHGDGADSDIAIIGANRTLWYAHQSVCCKHINQLPLIVRLPIELFLTCKRKFEFLFKRNRSAPDSCMRFRRKVSNLFRRGAIHSCFLLLRSIAKMNTICFQNTRNGAPGAVQHICDALDADSISVQCNSSVNVDRNVIQPTNDLDAVFVENTSNGLVSDTIPRRNFGNSASVLIGSNDLGYVELIPTAESGDKYSLFFEDDVDVRLGNSVFLAKFSNGSSVYVLCDKVTSVTCRQFSGHVYNLQTDSSVIVANHIVTHNCRCALTPVLKSWEELGIDGFEDFDESTRASMDGQVSGSMTFEDWFEALDAARQEAILGKGRYELYKSGKISFSDLVDQNGRGLTVEALYKKNNVKKN